MDQLTKEDLILLVQSKDREIETISKEFSDLQSSSIELENELELQLNSTKEGNRRLKEDLMNSRLQADELSSNLKAKSQENESQLERIQTLLNDKTSLKKTMLEIDIELSEYKANYAQAMATIDQLRNNLESSQTQLNAKTSESMMQEQLISHLQNSNAVLESKATTSEAEVLSQAETDAIYSSSEQDITSVLHQLETMLSAVSDVQARMGSCQELCDSFLHQIGQSNEKTKPEIEPEQENVE
ncbi:hypothetical protein PCE1_001308 [Barthelona sp. PCE]